MKECEFKISGSTGAHYRVTYKLPHTGISHVGTVQPQINGGGVPVSEPVL
jgi:hypothetical protein